MSAAARNYIRERILIEDRGYLTPCWIWQRWLTPKGYAQAEVPGYGKKVRVHRATYELYVGPIPEGLVSDHLCRVRSCCNPEHIEMVTARENTLRGLSPPALNARKTHCPAGHEYTEENTHWPSQGGRQCRACHGYSGAGRGRTLTPHCAKGHAWTPENTRIDQKGARRCRICLRANDADRRQREWGRKAAANRVAGGTRGNRLRVTNAYETIQAKQDNQTTHSKSRFSTGRGAK